MKHRHHPNILINELTCTSDILDDGVLFKYFHNQYDTEAYLSIIYGDPLALKIYDNEEGLCSFIEMDYFVKINRETLRTLEFRFVRQKIYKKNSKVQPNRHE